MKRFIVTAILALLLVGCNDLVPDTSPVTFYILNSPWKVVKTEMVPADSAYATTVALQKEVDAYNATTNDDQHTLATGTVPEDPGPATVYLVYSDDWTVYESAEVERVNLEGMLQAARLDVEMQSGQSSRPMLIFVDKIPPQPVVVVPAEPAPPPDPYVLYALYMVKVNDGSIVYEFHMEDATAYGQMATAFSLDMQMHNGQNPSDLWYIVTGQLYTPPVGG